jgi:predicted unusual protein kinase regulating ubiquinone biosynthesis (AarF/ABC1/UbiB family)
MSRSDDIPTGRLKRAAKTTGALGPSTVRLFSTLAGNVARDPERGAELLGQRHEQLAEQAVEVLASLRGGAMKIGQLASFLDVEFIPPEFREMYQEKLATLRDSAPPMEWKKVKRVLEQEWGESPESIFESFDETAAAAASIGQVHRAVMPDGRAVAVKVQYPEIADALEADLGTASILVGLARAVVPGMDPQEIAGELRERVMEELDYELEAQNQRAFARAYRDHPFIHVPSVVGELSRRRVFVSDWVDGIPFVKVRDELPDDERQRFGEIVYRFFFGSMHYLGRFNVDAHPGNYMLMEDGRVAFIDFGSVKEVNVARLRTGVQLMTAAAERDSARVADLLVELGYIRAELPDNLDRLMAQVRNSRAWVIDDRDVTIDRKYVSRVIASQSKVDAEAVRMVRAMRPVAEDMMLERIGLGVFAVLGQLGVTRNWHRIAREVWFGDEAHTPLGVAEQAFFRGRGVVPVLVRS